MNAANNLKFRGLTIRSFLSTFEPTLVEERRLHPSDADERRIVGTVKDEDGQIHTYELVSTNGKGVVLYERGPSVSSFLGLFRFPK